MNKTSGDASLGIDANLEQQTSEKAQLLYSEDRQRYHAKIDRLFCLLFCIQWPAAIALAVFMTPTTWAGTTSSVHLHVFMAIGLGAMATVFPIWLCWRRPGAVITRHVIAASTMIFTALFIHLSGGRDEGHFHFFMMMAFVTLYFDWKVVLTAIVVGAIDHVLRTALFPISVFGVLESPWFQLFRHVLWVVFEGSVLLYGCMLVDRDKRTASQQLAVSQMREEKINDLMERNSAASAEKEEHEKIAREAAQAKNALEHQRLEDTRVAAQKQAEETALLKHKVDKLLVSVNDAVNGNLGTRVTVNGEDAIGLVGGALDKLLGSLSANFDHIQSSADTLSDAAKELSATSSDLKNDASDASESIEQVSDSASQINHGVQDTAASTEQMNEAIREVSRCAADAVQVGEEAVVLASQATSTVEQLGISSTGIGDVLKVITSIAEQTNLLALNATIEAARAGDAGKGFAVVANEVKELAKETAKATDEISSRIKAIQSDAGNAGSVIEKISCIIEQIKEYQMTVAAAVEEQTATTREISNNVRLSAQGSADVLQGINVIADRVNRAQKSAEHFDSAALTLKGTVVQLNQLLEIYSTDSSQAKPAD